MSLTKSDLTKINTLFSKMDGGDFKTVANLFKQHQTNVATMATGNFSVGDSVFFVNRSGQKISGVVEKVMQKNIKVSTSDGNWRVPATMLKAS
jgi:hypothetical protein